MNARELQLLKHISTDDNFTAESKNDRDAAKKLIAAGAIMPVRTTFLDTATNKVSLKNTYKLTPLGMRLIP